MVELTFIRFIEKRYFTGIRKGYRVISFKVVLLDANTAALKGLYRRTIE